MSYSSVFEKCHLAEDNGKSFSVVIIEPAHDETNKMACAPSVSSDQMSANPLTSSFEMKYGTHYENMPIQIY